MSSIETEDFFLCMNNTEVYLQLVKKSHNL